MKKVSAYKLAARDEVRSLLKYLDDYNHVSRKRVMELILELRLVIRQANNGASGELEDGSDDYNPSLSQAEAIMCILNMLERDNGIKVSTYETLGRIDWKILSHAHLHTA
jgi:hypothetical protein